MDTWGLRYWYKNLQDNKFDLHCIGKKNGPGFQLTIVEYKWTFKRHLKELQGSLLKKVTILTMLTILNYW